MGLNCLIIIISDSIWREYDAMVALRVCVCDSASSYKDHAQLLKLMQFMMGLDDVYAPIKSTILTTEPLPTVKEAFSLLSRDESHRTMHSGVLGPGDNKKRFNNSNARNPNLVCTNCNMTSHTIEKYFELIGYPANFKKKGVTSQNVVSSGSVSDKGTGTSTGISHIFTSEQYQRLMCLLSDTGSSKGAQNNVAGKSTRSNFVFCFLSSSFFNKHRNISTYSAFVGWIIDYGASQHITFTTEFLFNVIDVSHLNVTVAHPNGTIAKVNQIGNCKISDKIVLYDVLVVPGYQVSLLSVHQLAKVNKMLGHPTDQVFDVLKDKIDLKGFQSSEPCEVCHRAKQTRDPFPLSDHKTSSLDDLVHLDVWGPYRVTSRDGFRDVKFYETVYPFKNDYLTKEYITEQSGVNNLNFFDNHWPCKPYDDERDPNDGGGTNSSYVEPAVEAAGADSNSTADPSASTSDSSTKKGTDTLGSIIAEGGADDDGAALKDDDFISEGEDGKVKYEINSVVNYSNLSRDNFSFITNINKTSEPKTYKEAVLNSKWVEAMNSEIEALNKNNTWVITDLPKGRKPIGQKVVKMVTVRCVLSLAVQNNWNIFQLDINNAFLYGELIEDVYMTLPEGYFSPNDKRVCKLQKSLYGLKQAPRKWNEKLTSVLVDYGFQQSKNDYSLYTKSKGNSFVILFVYVDDILITGNDISEINLCKDLLSSRFMIKDLGVLKYFLGIEVIKNDKGMCLSQRKYSLELLNEFGMLACKPSKTPLYVSKNKNKPVKLVDDDDKFLENVTGFQKLVGKLIYLTLTRPDISYAMHKLSVTPPFLTYSSKS
ncbi:putative RNA-directed DNA polymerase [Tanacetum coccineum]